MKLLNWLALGVVGCALGLALAGCGGSKREEESVTAPRLSLLAGDTGGQGNADGDSTISRFSAPRGIATDSAGNVYVADTSNHTIRKITPQGVASTLAGTGATAVFISPGGVATDGAGNVFVADTDNHAIRKITPAGNVSLLAGGSSGSSDGNGTSARFFYPGAIATDSVGNIYVADTENHTIRKITPTGDVSTLAGAAGTAGAADGNGSNARFSFPLGVAVDSAGNVFVADAQNHAIRRITPTGDVSTLAGSAGNNGTADGTGANARFDTPMGLAIDSGGTLYVADYNNHTIRKITPGGVVSTLAGSAGIAGATDGNGVTASFYFPRGLATDGAGNVYVADTENHSIRKITPGGVVSTFGGAPFRDGAVDGDGANARFTLPQGLAADSGGHVYVADSYNGTIRKITPGGTVSTLVGWVEASGGSGSPFPRGMAIDNAGNVYMADARKHVIRKITPQGVASTWAGSAGRSGFVDGNGVNARFNTPSGVATDFDGNVYVADTFNHTIRKITPGGDVSTLAGLARVPGIVDGDGANAMFSQPFGLTTDSAGNVYVADTRNHAIRKITPGGTVSTLAGLADNSGAADGNGSGARFESPRGVAIDSAGTIYVADTGNHAIRKITPSGDVSTFVGRLGQSSFQAGELPGLLASPFGLALQGRTLFILTNNAVVQVTDLP